MFRSQIYESLYRSRILVRKSTRFPSSCISRYYSIASKKRREPSSDFHDLDARRSLMLEQLRSRNMLAKNALKNSESPEFPWELQIEGISIVRGYLKRVLDDHRLHRLPDAIATAAAKDAQQDDMETFLLQQSSKSDTSNYDWSRGFHPPAEPPQYHLRRYQKWTELTSGRDHVDLIYSCRLMMFLAPFYMRNMMKAPEEFISKELLENVDLPFKRHQSTECILKDLTHSFLFTNQQLMDMKGIEFFQNLYLNQLRLPAEPWLFHPAITVHARRKNFKEMWKTYEIMKQLVKPNAHTLSIIMQSLLVDHDPSDKVLMTQMHEKLMSERKRYGLEETEKDISQKSWAFARSGRIKDTLKTLSGKKVEALSIFDINTAMIAYASRANVHRNVDLVNFLGLYHSTVQALMDSAAKEQKNKKRLCIDVALEKALDIFEKSPFEPTAKTYHTLLGLIMHSQNYEAMPRLIQTILSHLKEAPAPNPDRIPETNYTSIYSKDIVDGFMWNYCITWWMAKSTVESHRDNYINSVNKKPAKQSVNAPFKKVESFNRSMLQENEELWETLSQNLKQVGQPWTSREGLLVPVVDGECTLENLFATFSKHIRPNATTLGLLLFYCDVNKIPSVDLWLQHAVLQPQWRTDRFLREQLKRMGRWQWMLKQWEK